MSHGAVGGGGKAKSSSHASAVVKVEGVAGSAGETNSQQEPDVGLGQLHIGQPAGNEGEGGSVASSAVVQARPPDASSHSHLAMAGGGKGNTSASAGSAVDWKENVTKFDGQDINLSASRVEEEEALLQVNVNVVGLFIPGQPFPRRALWSKKMKNVVLKSLLFDCKAKTTVREILNLVLQHPYMIRTREWFEDTDESVEDHFEPLARTLKPIAPQFRHEETDDPSVAVQYDRFAYKDLEWSSALESVPTSNPKWVHIVFAIWQPRQSVPSNIKTPFHILIEIRKVMPSFEQIRQRVCTQQEKDSGDGIFESWGQWKKMDNENDDAHKTRTESYLDSAAFIVRDSILWDFEQLLGDEIKDAKLRPLSASSSVSFQVVQNLIRNQISLRQLIAAKVYTLSLWAVCLDLGHWVQDAPLPQPEFPFLRDVKGNSCPTCGIISNNQSFYRHILSLKTLQHEFKESLRMFSKKTNWIYRGLDINYERNSCDSFEQDPRESILVNLQPRPVGRCLCHPFHDCQRPVCAQNQVYQTNRDQSFSSKKEYADSTYSKFEMKSPYIKNHRDSCKCECLPCKSAKQQRESLDPDRTLEFILKRLSDSKDKSFDINDATLIDVELFLRTDEIPAPSEEAQGLFLSRLPQAANELVRLGVCSETSGHQTLIPGPLCRGTVLEIEYNGFNIDAVSAAKFATGVNEDEVIVPAKSQFVLKSIQHENELHPLSRMKLQNLVNINSAGRNEISALPYIEHSRDSAQMFCSKRDMRPGGKCYDWQDVKYCCEGIFSPHAPRGWKGVISFGSTDKKRPVVVPAGDKFEQFRQKNGRLAYLYDERQCKASPAFCEKWEGFLETQKEHLAFTFADLARDAETSSPELQKKCRELDLRFLKAEEDRKKAGAAVNRFCLTPEERQLVTRCVRLESLNKINGKKSFHGSPKMSMYPYCGTALGRAFSSSPWDDDEASQIDDEDSLSVATGQLSITADASPTARELLRLWRMAGAELQYPIGDLDFPFTSKELASISSEEASDPKPDDAPVDGGGGEGNHTSTGHSTSSGNQ